MKLIIDIREHELIGKLKEENVEFETKALDVGDILFEHEGEIFLVIERKTVADLKASICDGRAREQKARLVGSGVSKSRILYLIEGSLNKPLEAKLHSMAVSTLVGSIINTQFRDGISVYKTQNITETTLFVKRLFQKFTEDTIIYFSEKNITEQSYVSTLKKKKKDNMTPSVWFIAQLALVPQVTEKIARCIIEKYPSVVSLVTSYQNATESERPKMLAEITYPIKNDKKRRIGQKISERIFKIFYSLQ